jgi:Dolichyl-phosphate-mannose-protein mannosyltransferase
MNRFFTISFDWLKEHWRGVASALIIATIAILTLSLQLTTLVQGQSKFETATLDVIKAGPAPWNQPVNAPYTVPTYILGNIIDNTLQAGRIVSVVYGLLSVALFFYVLKRWFNIRIATVGSLLLITSSWLLHVSHMASPLILMVFASIFCLATITWLFRAKKYKYLAVFAFSFSVAFAMYVPYMPWLLIITFAVLLYESRGKLNEAEPWHWIAGGTMGIILVIPLVLGVINEPSALRLLFGIPADLPSVTQYIKNLGNIVGMVFFRSPPLPELHLGRLPMLDLFSSVMFLMGIYYFAKRIKNRRSIILFTSFAVLLLVLPLSGGYQLGATILLPLVYLTVTSGVVELLKQWYSYFPRNPLARSIGVGLIVVAIGFTSFYHLQRYFIAWPNTPDTKNSYMVQSDKK